VSASRHFSWNRTVVGMWARVRAASMSQDCGK
jgi:hypothetical protein